MKKGKHHLNLLVVLMGLLMLFGAGMTASAETAVIGGVEYTFHDDRTASAYIDEVRSDHLPTELYIPRKIKYRNVSYKVDTFLWDRNYYPNPDRYDGGLLLNDDSVFKQNAVIPDKSRSYQACLKKITFARGVKVSGQAYGYEELKQVVFEDPNDLEQAKFYNCPKLKRLHLPADFKYQYNYDIKNCPSLKVTIDKKNKRLRMVEGNICSKYWGLKNVASGKKYYKIPKGIKSIASAAFWGDTAIEKIHLRKVNIQHIHGLPNLKRIKVNRAESKYDTFYWNSVAYCPSLKRVDLPESIRYIYRNDLESQLYHSENVFATIQHVYLYSKNLKGGEMDDIPAGTTFHVRNKKVAKQLRRFGFKGNIVVEKNMK